MWTQRRAAVYKWRNTPGDRTVAPTVREPLPFADKTFELGIFEHQRASGRGTRDELTSPGHYSIFPPIHYGPLSIVDVGKLYNAFEGNGLVTVLIAL